MSDQKKILTLEEIPEAVGFPYTVMPTGWFQVGWSHELAVGDVKPLYYFKQHLVVFRTEANEAVVMTAFCPHMGAHLGHGGKVDGCNIVCPYHGWSWSAEGYSVKVPATGEPSTAGRRIRKWSVVESNGIIWLWHDALAREPLYDAPEERRQEADFLPVSEHTIYSKDKVHLHPQFTMENVVDVDHLIFIHGSTLLPEKRAREHLPELIDNGPRIDVNYAPPNTLNEVIGIGVIRVDFQEDPVRPWRTPTRVYACTTPIDNEYSDIFGTVFLEQDKTAEGGDQNVVPMGRAKKRIAEQAYQNQVDFFVWDNMVYMNRVPYAPLEGKAFITMRRWAQQFYPEGELAPTIQK
jgi:phenylpropionate dioxygenase-like ring-hydroxylating dioxygenase large terminal subunit